MDLQWKNLIPHIKDGIGELQQGKLHGKNQDLEAPENSGCAPDWGGNICGNLRLVQLFKGFGAKPKRSYRKKEKESILPCTEN